MRNAQDLGFLSSNVHEYRQRENVIRGGEEKSGVRERESTRARAASKERDEGGVETMIFLFFIPREEEEEEEEEEKEKDVFVSFFSQLLFYRLLREINR